MPDYEYHDIKEIMTPSPRITDVYDSDTLNYLKDGVKDDLKEDLIDQIEKANLTPDCKKSFKLLVDSATSFEYVVNKYSNDEELRKRKFELREVIGWLKSNTRQVNLMNGDFVYLMSLVERHFANKIIRSRHGFTVESHITQNINTHNTETVKNAQPEPKSGFNRIIGGNQQ